MGKNTTEAMRIGAHLGYRGMVREIIAELRNELGRNMNVCATGGFARWVLDDFNGSIPVDPHLTLKGLARIAGLNRSRIE